MNPKIIAPTSPIDHAKILDEASDPIVVLNSDYQFTYANKAFAQALGKTLEVIIGNDLWGIYQKDGADMRRDTIKEVFETGQIKVVENVVPKPSGNLYFITTFKPIFNEQNIVISVVAIAKDITDRKRVGEALKKREALLNEMGTIAKVGGWEFDTESQKQVWTKEVYNIHEVDESYEPTVSKGIEFYVPASRLVIERAVQRAIEYGEPFDVELEIITAKGNHRWVHANGKVDWKRGIKKINSGTFQDITERRQAEEKIRHMAYHDSLTGLPNRKLFSDRLDIALIQAQRNKKEVGIAMLDLDNFKDVNDTRGHTGGDLLLKAAAERLSAALRKGDTVSRMGGDEFILILPDLKGTEDAIQVAQKIVESFRKPFFIDTHQLVVTTSIGIAVYPNDGMDGDILLKNADIAMYQAKEAGRDRYQIYNKA